MIFWEAFCGSIPRDYGSHARNLGVSPSNTTIALEGGRLPFCSSYCAVFFVVSPVSQKTARAPPRAVTVAPGCSLAGQFFCQVRAFLHTRISQSTIQDYSKPTLISNFISSPSIIILKVEACAIIFKTYLSSSFFLFFSPSPSPFSFV